MWVRREYGVRIPETPDEICYGEPDPFDPVYMDPETVQQAIASARDDCDLHGCGVALRLSYDAVMRASELVQVRRRDIDISSATVYVQATKGSQNADVGLDRATVDRLERFLDPEDAGGPLFENSYGRPWSATAWASHVLRNHVPEGSHAFGRHAPVMHRLEGADPGFMDASFETEDFGDVFRRARHTNPGQTAEYARVVGVSVPEWADGD
jgi:integrase